MHTVLVNHLGLSLPRKSGVRLTDHLHMTIVVDWDVKQQNKLKYLFSDSYICTTSQENLSSGFATRQNSNLPAQLQKLARVLKLWI